MKENFLDLEQDKYKSIWSYASQICNFIIYKLRL